MSLSRAKPDTIGIDFGGTAVKMARVNGEGRIVGRTGFDTRSAPGIPAWLDAVTTGLKELAAGGGRIAGVGVGVPGFVDYDEGFIYDLPNVPGWKEVLLGPLLRKRIGLPVRVDNDVNVMALGECAHGAGRSYRHAVFVTLGTGVGGGLLLNGELYRGAHHMAGEIGHLSIERNGIRSPQGRGGLEQYVGNRRVVARAVRQLRAGAPSMVRMMCGGDWSKVTMEMIGRAAKKGDPLALGIYDFMGDCIATAFASVTYLIQPEVFIVGGGVSLSGHVVFAPIRKHLAARLSPVFASRVRVIPADLGNDAGVIGGATLARSA